jgi:hypothetical protein
MTSKLASLQLQNHQAVDFDKYDLEYLVCQYEILQHVYSQPQALSTD